MPVTLNPSGMASDYAVDVRRNGKLLYHEASVMFPDLPPMPPQPTCYTVECINAYKKSFDRWAEECKKLADFYRYLHEYHSARCNYCMRHKGEAIEDKYTSGSPAPRTVEEAKQEIKLLNRR